MSSIYSCVRQITTVNSYYTIVVDSSGPRPCRSSSVCCVCVLSSHLFRTSDLWTYQPGRHRKVTQDFSTFLLRSFPSFLSREGFSRPFFSSTVKSNFVYLRIDRSPLVGRKNPVRVSAPRFELTSQRQKVSRLPQYDASILSHLYELRTTVDSTRSYIIYYCTVQ